MLLNLPVTGIDFLLENKTLLKSLEKRKIGVIANQNSLTKDYQISALALLKKLGNAIKCFLSPEHGWSGFVPEGVKINQKIDSPLGVPIFSLYGGEKAAQEFILNNNIDTLIVDLQDVGLRCYTYTATCAKVLEAIAGQPIEIIICDRPNPLGSAQKGPLLEKNFQSLVGYLDVPFQHGQTIGKLLSNFNQDLGTKQLPFTLISCQEYHLPYQYPWIPPSPNLASWDAVLLYPALVLLEGTNISEGRGTSLPFTCLGAPGLDTYALINFLNQFKEYGIRVRPLTFTPHRSKFQGKECQGVQIFITDFSVLDSFSLGLEMLNFLRKNYINFKWESMGTKKKSYFIDYLLGTESIRHQIDQGAMAGF